MANEKKCSCLAGRLPLFLNCHYETRHSKMRISVAVLFFWLTLVAPLNWLGSQTLWPGDVNNNGIVNGVDLLYLGLAYGTTGPERNNATEDWEGQPITALWPGTFPDGLNFAYADCDGDGEIDSGDIDIIAANFGLTHGEVRPDGYANGLPGIDPPLLLKANQRFAEPGALVSIDLALGTTELPVEDFYGISVSFSYDSDLVNDDDDDDTKDELEFEKAEDAWTNPPGRDDAETLLVTNGQTGTGELAITRTDQLPVSSGSGRIGAFSVVIEDIIVGLQVDTFNLRIDSLKLIDRDLNTYSIVPDSASIFVTLDSNLVTSIDRYEEAMFQVFPNPAGSSFYVQSEEAIEGVALYNAVGQRVEAGALSVRTNLVRVTPRHRNAGTYLLRVQTKERILTKTIILLNGQF